MRCTVDTDRPLAFAMSLSGVLRATLQRPYDHGFDASIVNRTRRAGARLVVQPGQALLDKTPPPLAHGLPVQPQLGRHFRVLTTFRTGQHDPGLSEPAPAPSSAASSATSVRHAHHRLLSGKQVAGPPLETPSLVTSILGKATIYSESMIANL
jgi:hypothetical protein